MCMVFIVHRTRSVHRKRAFRSCVSPSRGGRDPAAYDVKKTDEWTGHEQYTRPAGEPCAVGVGTGRDLRSRPRCCWRWSTSKVSVLVETHNNNV